MKADVVNYKTMESKAPSKKEVMRKKILNMDTLKLKGKQMIPDFKIGKKIKLEIEAELLNEKKGLNQWQLAEGEKIESYQTVLIKNIKVISDKE